MYLETEVVVRDAIPTVIPTKRAIGNVERSAAAMKTLHARADAEVARIEAEEATKKSETDDLEKTMSPLTFLVAPIDTVGSIAERRTVMNPANAGEGERAVATKVVRKKVVVVGIMTETTIEKAKDFLDNEAKIHAMAISPSLVVRCLEKMTEWRLMTMLSREGETPRPADAEKIRLGEI